MEGRELQEPRVPQDPEPQTPELEAKDLLEPQVPLNLAPPDFPFGSLATILVGPDEYRFDVHKEVLSRASAFFKTAFESNFIESHGTVRLPEQEVTTFKCFIRWVYTRRLLGSHDTDPPSLRQIKIEAHEEAKRRGLAGPDGLPWDDPLRLRRDLANYRDLPLLLLVKLYILADVLQVHGLQDTVIGFVNHIYFPRGSVGTFWQQGDNRPAGLENPVESINLVWAMTPERSLLRKLIVTIVCAKFRDVYSAPFDDTLDPDFIKQVSQTLLGWQRKYCSWTSNFGRGWE